MASSYPMRAAVRTLVELLWAQRFRHEPMRQHTHISWFGCRTQQLEGLFASVGFAEELVLVSQRLDFAFESGHGVR